METGDRRLIEDYLPLEALNAIAAREKLHPRRYVEMVHYWPARRPISAVRAAIYAALVPAPRSDDERKDAAAFVGRLAAYQPDPPEVGRAAASIRELHGGRAPKVLDPFAGGGSIPLEAARLGCESHAVDYNPVAHLIELCTLVYPQRFGSGLADDFERWSGVLLERMRQEVGDLYPPVSIPDADAAVAAQTPLFDGDADDFDRRPAPVAYVWARTVPCRRPGCAAPVPLVRQAWLRKRGDLAVAALPRVDAHDRLRWEIVSGNNARDVSAQTGQTGAGQAVCAACATPAPADYVKAMAAAGRMGESLAAVVSTAGKREQGKQKRGSKLYLSPAVVSMPSAVGIKDRIDRLTMDTGLASLDEQMNTADSTTVAGRGYGISRWRELFTSRQLLVLFTLVKHLRRIHREMRQEGMDEQRALALATYFSMAFGRLVISFNKFTRWEPRVQRSIGAIGDRQALKMVYDYSEINCLSNTQGCLPFALDREAYCMRELAGIGTPAVVTRGNAEKLFYADETFDAVITDPPYYSSIYYADLSAFFYVWLKRILGDLYPDHFALPAPPKRREAVAQPSEHGGDKEQANAHYQELMRRSFAEARRVLKPGAPLVCVYAHRTTEGWATLIRALVGAGLTVTEAWPVQTESRGRVNAQGAAALSDSIFFVARRRQAAATGRYETEVEPELRRIARERVRTLWAGGAGIGGADLLMAAVGAGLRAYTQFSAVEYANGEPVPAERFLQVVEGEVLEVMLAEIFGLSRSAVGSVDALTQFYLMWRFTYREGSIPAGEAYVFCPPFGIEIAGAGGLSGPAPALVEQAGGRFRVRTYDERGGDRRVGAPANSRSAPLIDVLHRVLWLLDNRPAELPDFLDAARPNQEQLRLVAEALAGPAHGRSELRESNPTAEQRVLARLNANWRSVIEGAAFADEIDRRVTGQHTFTWSTTE